jgi:GNAT superfamily N-acetyltransferase
MTKPSLTTVQIEDFERMADVRIEVLRESLERLGRFDAERARSRLAANFVPEDMRHIELDGERVGYITLRQKSIDVAPTKLLEHLYVRNAFQNRGLGAWALDWAKSQARGQDCDIKLSALKLSDANRFYLRHGFVRVSEDEFDVNYQWSHNGKAAL